jgi:hypothetical protein
MKRSYDFSKGEKNPYFKKLKGKKLQLTEEVSFEIKDLLSAPKKKKKPSKAKAPGTRSQKHV